MFFLGGSQNIKLWAFAGLLRQIWPNKSRDEFMVKVFHEKISVEKRLCTIILSGSYNASNHFIALCARHQSK